MAGISRRAFLRGSLVIAGASSFLYGWAVEATWLDVAHVEMPLRNLPDAFADFTIAQISDLHLGACVRLDYIESVVDSVLALNADAVVITGDLVSRITDGEPDMLVQTLSRLRAPQGVHAVLGNHDWWVNGSLVIESLRRAGVNVLVNEHLTWRRGGQALYLAGVDDVWCGMNDLQHAFAGIPADAAVIALVHEPDYADIVARDAGDLAAFGPFAWRAGLSPILRRLALSELGQEVHVGALPDRRFDALHQPRYRHGRLANPLRVPAGDHAVCIEPGE